MYAIEYKTDSCGICKTVEGNLKKAGIKFTAVDKSQSLKNKIYKTPYTEFYTDDGILVDHRIGFMSVPDIHHIINVYDKKAIG